MARLQHEFSLVRSAKGAVLVESGSIDTDLLGLVRATDIKPRRPACSGLLFTAFILGISGCSRSETPSPSSSSEASPALKQEAAPAQEQSHSSVPGAEKSPIVESRETVAEPQIGDPAEDSGESRVSAPDLKAESLPTEELEKSGSGQKVRPKQKPALVPAAGSPVDLNDPAWCSANGGQWVCAPCVQGSTNCPCGCSLGN